LVKGKNDPDFKKNFFGKMQLKNGTKFYPNFWGKMGIWTKMRDNHQWHPKEEYLNDRIRTTPPKILKIVIKKWLK